MLYAKVVVGLPIDGPFDYLVPAYLERKLSLGARVWVNFRNKKEVAYVVGLSSKTKIKKLKEISAAIDATPILGEKLLLLTKRLAEYYCCSWGQAIETAIPEDLRKGKKWGQIYFSGFRLRKINLTPFLPLNQEGENKIIFLSGQDRMPVYLREIKVVLAAKQSAIVLFSDISAAERAKDVVGKSLGIEAYIVFRNQPKELETWEKIMQAEYCVVVGTRSSVFSPVNNLGLIIIDQEEDQVYKQEQSPHYHAREVALMRAEIEDAKVILGSHSISLESFYLAQKDKLKFEFAPAKTTYPGGQGY